MATVDSEYAETVKNEAEKIMGACVHLDEMIDELRERIDPATLDEAGKDEWDKYIEGLHNVADAISKHAEVIGA